MHIITVRRRTTADPATIWALWADPAERPRWDDALEAVELEGPFEAGARGVVRLKGQPDRRLEVLECVSPRQFTERVTLPLGGKMDWHHRIDDVNGAREVRFDVTVRGPTAFLLALVLRRVLARALPPAVEKLVGLAEDRA
jgi:hypothetical protein